MRLFRRFHRHGQPSPTWQDTMPARDTGPRPGRYLHIPQIDRWRAAPFDMPPPPERGTVLQRVRQYVESLDGAVDEGSGASLDALIESWTASWIATAQTDYADHCGVTAVHRGQAVEWLAEAARNAEDECAERDRLQADYLACRSRLTGEPPGPTGAGDPQEGPDNAGTGQASPAGDGVARGGWAAPHLVAGLGLAGLAAGGVLVLLGALTDTIAFRNILELALRTITGAQAWLMAAGATSMALTAAGSLGIALAIRRRGTSRTSWLAITVSAAVWLGLGAAMFAIRWKDGSGATGPSLIPGTAPHTPSTLGTAVFFAAIYLISGTCTLFEAERLYNPEFFALRRLHKRYRKQAARAAAAQALAERAQAAVDQHDGEFDRESSRLTHAITDRQALGAEAANYARVLMAAMLRDPAKTHITETGPIPQLPPSAGNEPPPPPGPSAEAA